MSMYYVIPFSQKQNTFSNNEKSYNWEDVNWMAVINDIFYALSNF